MGKDSVPPPELDIRRPNWSSEEFAPESDSLPLLPFADSERAVTEAEGEENDPREGAGDLYAEDELANGVREAVRVVESCGG